MLLNCVIFSKDRPPQLELLLRSAKACWTSEPGCRRIAVLLKTTTDDARVGYDRIWEEHPDVCVVREQEFVKDLQTILLEDSEYTQAMVDDDVFVRPWGLNDPEVLRLRDDPQIIAVTLRQEPSLDHCYTLNIVTPPPVMREDLSWAWPGLLGDWGYPNSVDGNLYRSSDLRGEITKGNWTAPNEFEPALRPACTRPLLTCYRERRIITIANNSVQDVCRLARNGGASQEDMNSQFLAGERIQLEPLLDLKKRSCHFEHPYEWERC